MDVLTGERFSEAEREPTASVDTGSSRTFIRFTKTVDRPAPAPQHAIKRNLRTRAIDSTDYAQSANPPILHRKETFLPPDHPLRSKFERLTRQEERAGLLDETATIDTRSGWDDRLRSKGYTLRGHRLVPRRAD